MTMKQARRMVETDSEILLEDQFSLIKKEKNVINLPLQIDGFYTSIWMLIGHLHDRITMVAALRWFLLLPDNYNLISKKQILKLSTITRMLCKECLFNDGGIFNFKNDARILDHVLRNELVPNHFVNPFLLLNYGRDYKSKNNQVITDKTEALVIEARIKKLALFDENLKKLVFTLKARKNDVDATEQELYAQTRQIAKEIVERFKGTDFHLQSNAKIKNVRQRTEAIKAYIHKLTSRYAELAVIRFDLAYDRSLITREASLLKNTYGSGIPSEEFDDKLKTVKADWKKLLHQLDRGKTSNGISLKKPLAGYMVNIAYSVNKGFHIHVILFIDIEYCRYQEPEIIQGIEKFWTCHSTEKAG